MIEAITNATNAATIATTAEITATTAEDLVAAHPQERIDRQIEVFDWLVQTKDKRVSKSPAGYLVESIRDDYAAPKGYVSKADRAKRVADEEARR